MPKMKKRGTTWISELRVTKSAEPAPVTPQRIAELEARLARANAALAKNMQPPEALSAQAKAAAKSVARQNFRNDPATRGALDQITSHEGVTPGAAFTAVLQGSHGDDLQAHAARHFAVALQAASDSLSLPAADAIETMKKIQATMLEDVEELRQQTEILKVYGADALASFHDLGIAREAVNTAIRKRRAERPHLTWGDAAAELDAAGDPEWSRLRRREERAATAHREGLAKGQSMNMERRIRSATAVYADMERASLAQHPELSPDAAMSKFMTTPSGQAMYAQYVAAGREQVGQPS